MRRHMYKSQSHMTTSTGLQMRPVSACIHGTRVETDATTKGIN